MVDETRPIKIMVIAGTRPEGIKLAPVIKEIANRASHENLSLRVCVTGQHRDMLDQVLEIFDITPDIDLDLMRANQTPSELAARVLLALEPVLVAERPDWVILQGDTTTVMASAIAAHHLHIKVGHVEAGLRTGDRRNPFPEEMNRLIAGQVSDMHFAPTQLARENLLREGICDSRILVSGNTVIDALLDVSVRPAPRLLADLEDSGKRTILVTAHRRENLGEPLTGICRALRKLVEANADVRVVFPVHLNPNVQKVVRNELGDVPRVLLLPPVDYLTLVHLMKTSYLILTDSGGIQEEAPALGVPVLVLRIVTERPEAVEAGVVRVVGTDTDRIVAEAQLLLDDAQQYMAMARSVSPYGDGHAARRIVDALVHASAAAASGI